LYRYRNKPKQEYCVKHNKQAKQPIKLIKSRYGLGILGEAEKRPC